MPVNYTRPEYDKWLPVWEKCRDVAAGQEAVHAKGTQYLSRLALESTEAYEARVALAVFYDATARTIEAMLGMLFRKPVTTEPPEAKEEDIITNPDGISESLDEFCAKVALEAVIVGRVGLLVDYTAVGDAITSADAEINGARPTTNIYHAESIINWKTDIINGVKTLTMVVLKEDLTVYPDEFTQKITTLYRVLDLYNGTYRVRLFADESETGNSDHRQVSEDIYPISNGATLDYIPFHFYPQIDITRPILTGLVNMNLSHYKTTADYEHGCHISGLPTLFISGYDPESKSPIYIGGPVAQAIPEEAKAYYVEVSSTFEALRNNMSDKENRMAVLGSNILKEDKLAAETAETANINRMGDVSTLSAISIGLSKAITNAMNGMLAWSGNDQTIEVAINRDFMPDTVDPQLITALLASVQAGEMSSEEFYNNLKRGELISDGVSFEEEQERIASQALPVPDTVVVG